VGYLRVVLGAALFASGCGADSNSGSTAGSEDDLAVTTTDSADVASAALEINDDDMTPLASPSFGYLRAGRPEIGVALRALAAGVSLCGNQVTVTPVTKTADCSAIGNAGQYRGGATIVFAGCLLPWGGQLDGQVVVDVTRQLAAGETCTTDALIEVTHAVTIANLVHVRPSGVRVEYPSATAHAQATHRIGQPPATRTLELAGERQVFGPGGRALLDHVYQGSATVALTAATSTSPPSLRIDASANIEHRLAHFTAAITVTGVVRVPTCCRPTEGQIALVRSGSIDDSHTLAFGPACGDVSLDGTALQLAECQ
jgi:hypothetical protein